VLRTVLKSVLNGDFMNETDESKYHVGEILYDPTGSFNDGCPLSCLLISRDREDDDRMWWRAVAWSCVIDGHPCGSPVKKYIEEELDRCERKGRIELPWHKRN
jgi:hypothetical protein